MLYTKEVTVTSVTPETIFTIPRGYVGHLSLLYLTNNRSPQGGPPWGGTGGDTISVYWDQLVGPDFYFVKERRVPATEHLQFSEGIVVLQEGDAIKAYLEDATASFGVLCTFDLEPAPSKIHEFNSE